MTERGERPRRILEGVEAPEPASRNVLEEDALDRLTRAEREHLLLRWLDDGHLARVL